MLTGAVLALLRHVPLQILKWVQRQVTVSVVVLSSDPCFDWLRSGAASNYDGRPSASILGEQV